LYIILLLYKGFIMATLGSVGIGSGVLTSDILDQLKENERTLQIDPIDAKIETNSQKTEALELLNSLVSTFQSSASELKDSSLYQKRTVSGDVEDEIEVTARDGVAIQDFSISDVSLAKTNVIQSGSFSSEDSAVASGTGTLKLSIDGEDFEIDYSSDMSYSDLKTKINDVAGDKLTASILQTSDDEYSFVFTSEETGANQQISIVDLDGKLNSSIANNSVRSGDFSSADDTISNGDSAGGTFSIGFGTDSFDFTYDETTTLQELADMINDDENASQSVRADIVNVGDDTTPIYNLVITDINSSGTEVTLSDTGDLKDALTTGTTTTTGELNNIQDPKDATFKYNGISMTRSSNTIDDIQLGLEIKLLKDDSSANVSITQDTTSLKEEMDIFVDAFNSLQDQIDSMTLADTDEEVVGIFNGNSSITGIGREIRNLISGIDTETGLSLSNFGLEIDRNGTMTFDSTVLDDKLSEDPDNVEAFFSGKTFVVGEFDATKDAFTRFADQEGLTFKELEDAINNGEYTLTDQLFLNEDFTFDDIKDFTSGQITAYDAKRNSTEHTDGIFEKLYDKLKSLNETGGTILSLSDGLSTEGEQLEENREKSLAALDARYDTMTTRFIQFDAMINTMNNQFAALETQIAMEMS
jgi:flagellar hook-associated protein 2